MKNIEYSMEDLPLSTKKNCNICDVDFNEIEEFEDHMVKHKTELGNPRNFNYDMNMKKAKKKLLKGANRKSHLDVEIKPTCVNLRFSDGSFQKVVRPMLQEWSQCVNKVFKLSENEIKIVEFSSGMDIKANHIDTKIVLFSDKDRFVIHVYNGTQNLMVQGRNFEEFAINHLQPFFVTEIEKCESAIESVNRNIKEVLGSGNIVKQKSKPFDCPNCKVKSSTLADLRMHLKSSHSKISKKKLSHNKKILDEDSSLLSDSMDSFSSNNLDEREKSSPEKPSLSCDWLLCEFESNKDEELGKHIEEEHVPVLRKKYLPVTVQETKNPEKCYLCPFESKTKDDLETHIKTKHEDESQTQIEEETNEICETIVRSGCCGKGFCDEKECLNHMEIHAAQFECETCKIGFQEDIGLEWHIETVHGVSVLDENCGTRTNIQVEEQKLVLDIPECVPCPFCQLKPKDVTALKVHIGNIHFGSEFRKCENTENIEVELSETCSKCTECDFVGSNNELKDHVNIEHGNSLIFNQYEETFADENMPEDQIKSKAEKEPLYCEICGLAQLNFAFLQEHINLVHMSEEHLCQYCVHRATSKEGLENHLIEAHGDKVILHTQAVQVNELTDKVAELKVFNAKLANDVQTILDNQNMMKQELFLLRNIHAAKQTVSEIKEPKCAPPPAPRRSSPPKRSLSPRRSKQPRKSSPLRSSTPQQPQSQHRRNQCDQKQKTLYVGDSVSAHVRMEVLEKATNTKITAAKAYSSIYDTDSNVAKNATKFPEANFSAILPQKLQEDTYENVIVQAGSVDISNLRTDIEPIKHSAYFQQEATISARNLFSACENAAMRNSSLKKIIIMKQTPRYDPPSIDPHSVKPVLSELYNRTLEQCLQSSQVKDRIFLGTHSIDCTGAIREARYRETTTGRFDGLHLYGSSGTKAYTNSVLSILKSAGMVDPEFDHSNCQQARFQARNRKQASNYFWQNDVDTRRSECERAQLNTRYEIPTQNRFASLADHFQGN